jgi:hypothetical protein
MGYRHTLVPIPSHISQAPLSHPIAPPRLGPQQQQQQQQPVAVITTRPLGQDVMYGCMRKEDVPRVSAEWARLLRGLAAEWLHSCTGAARSHISQAPLAGHSLTTPA